MFREKNIEILKRCKGNSRNESTIIKGKIYLICLAEDYRRQKKESIIRWQPREHRKKFWKQTKWNILWLVYNMTWSNIKVARVPEREESSSLSLSLFPSLFSLSSFLFLITLCVSFSLTHTQTNTNIILDNFPILLKI